MVRSATRRTPCVGICSTTYGDLVCRGCKRFAHEIVQWNGYEDEQKDRVWQRLNQLRDEVVAAQLCIADHDAYQRTCAKADCAADQSAFSLYRLTRYLVSTNGSLAEAGIGLKTTPAATADAASPPISLQAPLQVLQHMDAEIYKRSKAHYERNFKVPV